MILSYELRRPLHTTLNLTLQSSTFFSFTLSLRFRHFGCLDSRTMLHNSPYTCSSHRATYSFPFHMAFPTMILAFPFPRISQHPWAPLDLVAHSPSAQTRVVCALHVLIVVALEPKHALRHLVTIILTPKHLQYVLFVNLP